MQRDRPDRLTDTEMQRERKKLKKELAFLNASAEHISALL